MNKLEPTVLIALQAAGFPESQLADIFQVNVRTINDHLDCYNTGFDCALLYVGNRLEKAGFSDEIIAAVLGNHFYRDLRDSLLMLPTRSKEEMPLDQLAEYLDEEQIKKLKRYEAGVTGSDE